jgi:outer membrane protein OmpA-like peptidoglycan-associated protein
MIHKLFQSLAAVCAALALAGPTVAQPVDMTGRRVSGCELHRALGREVPPECRTDAPARAEEPVRFRGVLRVDRLRPTDQATNAPAATEPPRAEEPARPPPTRETPRTVAISVLFEFNSDRLTADAQQQLDAVGEVLKYAANLSDRFRIEGHTDAVGSDAYNQDLSSRRARSVIDYLATRHGVARERLEGRGFGRSQLLLPERPTDPRNRRVQVSNVGN